MPLRDRTRARSEPSAPSAVFLIARDGDHGVAARELLNSFAEEPSVARASVHHAPGAITLILVDDPPVELMHAFRDGGWVVRVVWERVLPEVGEEEVGRGDVEAA